MLLGFGQLWGDWRLSLLGLWGLARLLRHGRSGIWVVLLSSWIANSWVFDTAHDWMKQGTIVCLGLCLFAATLLGLPMMAAAALGRRQFWTFPLGVLVAQGAAQHLSMAGGLLYSMANAPFLQYLLPNLGWTTTTLVLVVVAQLATRWPLLLTILIWQENHNSPPSLPLAFVSSTRSTTSFQSSMPVVFPETWLPGLKPLVEGENGTLQVSPNLQIVGFYGRTQEGCVQNMVAVVQNGQVLGSRAKRTLAPFGEQRMFGILLSDRPLCVGTGPLVFPVAGVPTALLICYEIFDRALIEEAVKEGAQQLIVISRDAPLGNEDGKGLGIRALQLRAMELQLPGGRAALNGPAAIVGPDGAVKVVNEGLLER